MEVSNQVSDNVLAPSGQGGHKTGHQVVEGGTLVVTFSAGKEPLLSGNILQLEKLGVFGITFSLFMYNLFF